jgi:hypothetical protein
MTPLVSLREFVTSDRFAGRPFADDSWKPLMGDRAPAASAHGWLNDNNSAKSVVSTIYATPAKLYNCLLQHRAILARCQPFPRGLTTAVARFPLASREWLGLSLLRAWCAWKSWVCWRVSWRSLRNRIVIGFPGDRLAAGLRDGLFAACANGGVGSGGRGDWPRSSAAWASALRRSTLA